MLKEKNFHETQPALRNSEISTVVFIGSSLVFSEWILRSAASEAGEMEVLRFDSHASADLTSLAAERRLKLVILEDSQAGDLVTLIDGFRMAGHTAIWAVAYREASTGRAFLKQRFEFKSLADLRLLSMNVPIDVWTSMFRLALYGDYFIPCELMSAHLHNPDTSPAKNRPDLPRHNLTKREVQVLSLVSKGGCNKNIAHDLGLSEHTIKLHMHHILNKIGARNRTAASTWYLARQGET